MTLQELVKEVHRYGKDVAIVELKNGYTVAYEKGNELWSRVNEDGDVVDHDTPQKGKSFVKYALLSSSLLSNGHNAQLIDSGKWTGFSTEAKKTIDAYIAASLQQAENRTEQKSRRKNQQQLYEEMVKPLEIKTYKSRNWENIRVGSNIGFFGWPMLLYSFVTGKKLSTSGDGEIAALFGPLLLGYVIKELVIPSRKVQKITNNSILTSDNTGDNPAILFNYEDNPKKFTNLEIIFPNGISLGHYGACRASNQQSVLGRYRKAKYFLSVNKELQQELYDSFEDGEKQWEAWRGFNEQLATEDHAAFLKNIGFMEV